MLVGQNLTLKVSATNSDDRLFLEKVDYQKNHSDEKTINQEVENISDYLKQVGYFFHSLDSISKKDSHFVAYFSLGMKIATAVIRIPKGIDVLLDQINLQKDSIEIEIDQIESTLKLITLHLDNQGKSFSEVRLRNLQIKNKTFYADLHIVASVQRKINKVLIKEYSAFPKTYIKYHLRIDQETLFTQKKLIEISANTKSLKFVSEIKPPEILFAKDSTLLYVYLKKEPNSSFDGLVNFTSKETGGILFNGHIDLKLNNILDSGENFELFWNSIAQEAQDFRISTRIPYVFATPFTPKLSFNLYKQDSTFLSTSFHSSLSYPIAPKANLFLTYDAENSQKLLQNAINNIQDFENSFFGLGFSYEVPHENNLFEHLYYFSIATSFGSRTNNTKSTNQFKINLNTSFLWNLNARNRIFVKNNTGYLNSDNFLDNELFRIGGANSIRGFNEQSIFTASYTFFNTEYRYRTAPSSYLFSITDFGYYTPKQTSRDEFLLGIGFGYSFQQKNNTFRISSAIGRSSNTGFDFERSKLILNWTSNF